MRVYVVCPSRRAGWQLLREGDPDALHFADREAAIGYGRSLADVNRPSALKVESAYGVVEASWYFDAARPASAAFRSP
jgi:hypothetical protein